MKGIQVNADELKELIERLDAAPDTVKQVKRQAFERAAPQIKQALHERIGGTGKVKEWQDSYVGSKGGYAAVRPKAKTYAENNQGMPTKYAVGYVTNAIENGHRLTRKGKVPLLVFGKYFYKNTQRTAEQIARNEVKQAAEALRQELEG